MAERVRWMTEDLPPHTLHIAWWTALLAHLRTGYGSSGQGLRNLILLISPSPCEGCLCLACPGRSDRWEGCHYWKTWETLQARLLACERCENDYYWLQGLLHQWASNISQDWRGLSQTYLPGVASTAALNAMSWLEGTGFGHQHPEALRKLVLTE